MGCHSTREKAERQRRAIYSNEAASEEGSTVLAMKTKEKNQLELAEETREPWSGVLATIWSPTSDGRIIEGDVDWRELPVPFSVQEHNEPGHDGSAVCGRIEELEFIPVEEFDRAEDFDLDEVREGALVVWATGSLDGSEDSEIAKRLLENGAGVSVDGLRFSGKLWNREDLSEVDPEKLSFEDLIDGLMSMEILQGMNGKIAGVTVVNIPAFEEATVMIASASVFQPHVRIRFGQTTMTASAAGLAPLKPSRAWFEMEEAAEPTPLTVTPEGQVYGHLALWNQCHAGFASCEQPPHSHSGYQFFHVGQLETKEGDLVNVGRVTVGEAGNARGGHASIVLGRKGAMEHYDKSGCVAAFVRAKDGNHGIWLSGAVRSDAPAERVRDLRANPPSGDWRDYELVAVLSVPVPGFPIPRAEARLVASGASEEVAALVATANVEAEAILEGDEIVGWSFPNDSFGPQPMPEKIDVPTYRRMMRDLSHRREAALKTIT